jgi:hypothetical protein
MDQLPHILDGTYVRDRDLNVIRVNSLQVCNPFESIDILLIDDALYYAGYVLVEVMEKSLIWRSDLGDTVKWTKVSDSEASAITNYISSILKGETTVKPPLQVERPPTTPEDRPLERSSLSHNVPIVTPHQVKPEQTFANVETWKRVTPSDVNEMVVPVLKEADLLTLHLEQLQALAEALGIVETSMGVREIHTSVRVPFAMKLIESLKDVPDIENTVRQNLLGTGYDFFELKELLLRNYSTPTRIRRAIKNRLATLRFSGHGNAEAFISKASLIIAQVRAIASDDTSAEYVTVINALMAKLPMTLRQKLHSYLSDRAAGNRWELGLPFDDSCRGMDLFKSHWGEDTVVSLLRRRCELQLELEELQPPTTSSTGDRVNRVHAKPAQEFVSNFRSAYVVYPDRKTFIRDAESDLKKHGFETRQQVSAKGSVYFIVGSNQSSATTEEILNGMKPGIAGYRPFIQRASDPSKNSE